MARQNHWCRYCTHDQWLRCAPVSFRVLHVYSIPLMAEMKMLPLTTLPMENVIHYHTSHSFLFFLHSTKWRTLQWQPFQFISNRRANYCHTPSFYGRKGVLYVRFSLTTRHADYPGWRMVLLPRPPRLHLVSCLKAAVANIRVSWSRVVRKGLSWESWTLGHPRPRPER